MSDMITLKCDSCPRVEIDERCPWDPPDAVTMMVKCPQCDSGGFDDVSYWDSEDRELCGNPLSLDFGKPLIRNSA